MANKTRTDRGRRSEARERRRSRVSQPVEEVDQTARSGDSEAPRDDGNLTGAAAKVVGTAVAAGLLGALGGAAKALLERRKAGGQGAGPDTETARASDEEPDTVEPSQAEPASDEPEQQAGETHEEETAEPEPRARMSGDEHAPSEPPRGVSDGEAGEIVSKARSQLEGLLGTDVERVSGLERSDGRWAVTLEVVEVARVPESTDVMATYEVALDEEGSLVSVNQIRRYRRSQVDGQG